MTHERVNTDPNPLAVNAAESNRASTRSGLDDPRALEILTTEHWSLLSTRALGYQEILTRTTIFVATLSGTVVALALLAQATHFGRETLLAALLLIAVNLFLGAATFVRSLVINCEDARWVSGMNRLRGAYLEIVPDLERFFVTAHDARAGRKALGYGVHQRWDGASHSGRRRQSPPGSCTSCTRHAFGHGRSSALATAGRLFHPASQVSPFKRALHGGPSAAITAGADLPMRVS